MLNTRLLAIIKSEQERRDAPAVQTVKKKRSTKDAANDGILTLKTVASSAKSAFKILNTLNSIKIKQHSLIVPGKGHKNEEMMDELLDAGLKEYIYT